jgi:dTDP-4-dehydrorhamnose reductase
LSTLLIIGSNGQLGWELVRQSRRLGVAFHAVDFPDIDIADRESVRSCLKSLSVKVVVNAAAYTAVDRAESESASAFGVNCDGPAHLAEFCAEHTAALIHISTDYVFNGSKNDAYLETDVVDPLGIYGKSKAEGDAEIRRRIDLHVILRTAWLYGIHGQNFVKTMLKLGREREIVKVVADQRGCPTYASELAAAVLKIAGQHLKGSPMPWGTYHYCGCGSTTWHGFAQAIFEVAQKHESLKVKEVTPITTAEYPTPARRPANSILDCSKIEHYFGIRPRPWKDSLKEMIELTYRNPAGTAEK